MKKRLLFFAKGKISEVLKQLRKEIQKQKKGSK